MSNENGPNTEETENTQEFAVNGLQVNAELVCVD
jgi:hypothetical protein